MIDFTKHFCGECMDYGNGGCSEQCRPCQASETACYRLRKVRDFDPKKEESK